MFSALVVAYLSSSSFWSISFASAAAQESGSHDSESIEYIGNYSIPYVYRHYYMEDYMENFGVWPLDVMLVDEVKDLVEFPESAIDAVPEEHEEKAAYLGYYEDFGPFIREKLKEENIFYRSIGDGPVGKRHLDKLRQEDVYVRWVNDAMGYGCFANKHFEAYEPISLYAGNLVVEGENTDYMWEYSKLAVTTTKEGGEQILLGIDGLFAGNQMRFVNHNSLSMLNVDQYYIPVDGMWYCLYVASKSIEPHEQLFVSYGEHYWESRNHEVQLDEPETIAEPELTSEEAGLEELKQTLGELFNV